ncbi:MAG: CHAT domain-containing protein [Sphingomonadaceae bacterium]|nr:CHAT domain-containing protein [Sphingomonadaceae bacterium]
MNWRGIQAGLVAAGLLAGGALSLSAALPEPAQAQATSYAGYEEELAKIRGEIAATDDPGEKAYGYAQTALLLLGLNRTEEALADIAKGKALLRPQDDIPRGELLYTETYYLKETQRYAECEANMREAQPIYIRAYGDDHPYLAMIESMLARCLQEQGKYAEAIDVTRHVDSIFAKQGPEYGNQRAVALITLGKALQAANLMGEAEGVLRDALAPARQMPEKHPIRFNAVFALGTHLLSEGRPLEAIPLLQESIREAQENPAISGASQGVAYTSLAAALVQLDRPQEALGFYDIGIPMIEAAGLPLPAASNLRNAAVAADRAERGAVARDMAMKALEVIEAAPEAGELRIALAREAIVPFLVEEGKLAEAEEAARSSAEVLGRLRASNHPQATAARMQLGWVLARAGRVEEGQAIAQEAFRTAIAANREREYARNRPLDTLPSIIQFSQALQTAQIAGDEEFAFEVMQAIIYSDASRAAFAVAAREATQDSELGALLKRRQEAGAAVAEADSALLQAEAADADPAEQADLAARLASNKATLLDVDAELDQRFPAFRELIQPRPASLAEMQAELGRDEALLVIAESDRGLFTLAITRKEVVLGHDPIRRESLRGVVGSIRSGIDATLVSGEEQPFDMEGAARLYGAIFTPEVERALRGKKQLKVASGDILSALPLSVLVSRPAERLADARFLIEDRSVSVVPSLAAMGRGKHSRKSRRSLVAIGAPALPEPVQVEFQDEASAIGAAVLRSGQLGSLEPLPNALAEMERVAQLLQGRGEPLILAGANATEPAVKALDLSDVGVLLFATHGVVAGAFDDVDEPALVLTPPETRSALNDGLLTASEAALMDIGAEWVILSACDTAAGGRPSAAGYTGLARGFLFAGAQRVVASHWPVRDDISAQLSAGIVKASRDGSRPADALREAILSVKRENPHPALWAPFMVVTR